MKNTGAVPVMNELSGWVCKGIFDEMGSAFDPY
jgi:hypothetical protein